MTTTESALDCIRPVTVQTTVLYRQPEPPGLPLACSTITIYINMEIENPENKEEYFEKKKLSTPERKKKIIIDPRKKMGYKKINDKRSVYLMCLLLLHNSHRI